jgi:hypothetical protein
MIEKNWTAMEDLILAIDKTPGAGRVAFSQVKDAISDGR